MDYKRQIIAEFSARNQAAGELAAFRRDMDRTGQSVKRVAGGIARMAGMGGGIYGMLYGVREAVGRFAAFEKQMAQVSTMLDDQAMRYMPQYSEQLRRLAVDMGEGTETLAKGLYDILSASVAPSKAIKVLAASTKAAKAGLTDTGVAADAITTILNSYGLAAEKAGEVSDDLFAIVKRGKTTFAELAPNIGKVSSLAATAGLSFDDLGATIATLTRAGIDSEMAMTGVRSMITQFIKPSDDARKVAAEFGLVLDSNTLKTIGLTGVFGKLKRATIEQLTALMPNVRGMASFAAGVRQAEGAAADYEFMLGSAGQTEKAYQKIAETTATKLDRLKQKWIALKTAVGESIVDAADKIGQMKKDVDDISDAWNIGGGTKYGTFGGGMQQIPSGRSKGGIPIVGIPQPFVDPDAAMRSRGLPANVPTPFRTGGAPDARPGSDFVRQMEELREQQRLYDKHRATFDAKLAERGPKTYEEIWRAEYAARREAEDAYAQQMAATAKLDADNAYKRSQITAQMFEDMGAFGTGYFKSQRTLLDMERVDYEVFVQNKALMDEWYYTKLQKLAIDSSGVWKEMGSALQTVKGSVSDVFMGLEKWPGLLESISDSMRRMVSNLAAEMVMFNAMSALVGSSAASGLGFNNPVAGASNVQWGGLLGSLFPARTGQGFTNEMAVYGEPVLGSRQGGGYIPETGLYELHAGEEVKKPGGRSVPPTVNINNSNTGVALRTEGPPRFEAGEWVIGLVATNIENRGALYHKVSRVRR